MTEKLKFHNIYNARYFSLEEILKSFIPSKQYLDACNNNHSLIIGPRGCGKTTIFKMLTYPAKKELEKKHSSIKIDFFAIYIPADRQWLKQQEKLKEILPELNHEPLLNYFLVSNTIISIINSIQDLLHYSDLEPEESISLESSIVKNLFKNLEIEISGVASFSNLKEHLYKITRKVNESINMFKYKIIDVDEIKFPQLSYVQLMDVITPLRMVVLDAVKSNKHINSLLNVKWCLCFDELEIAPKWVSQELVDTLFRSVDQEFIFKLTSTPIIELNLYDNTNASINQDYEIIECWVKNRETAKAWEEFCLEYVQKNSKIEEPFRIFGRFQWELVTHTNQNSHQPINEIYEYNSQSYTTYKKLADNDNSFRKFLVRKNIDPNNPLPKNIKERNQVFRKIKPIVYSRFLFKKDGDKFRSRKQVPAYFGFDYITEICDGNVRSFLSILGKFKDFYEEDKPIPRWLQSKEIKEYSNNFYLGIKNYTEGYVDGSKYSLFKLIGVIAEYFSNEIYDDSFNMDPKGSFVLDAKVDDKIQEVVKAGILNGHILIKKTEYVNRKHKHGVLDENFFNSVLNKPLRLSYLLYPYFNIPKREYSKVKLRTIIHKNYRQGQTNINFE